MTPILYGLLDVETELRSAMEKSPPHNSAHESLGILEEEIDELRSHVHTKPHNRDLAAMRHEAIQVAAMGLRFAIEICNEERGRR